MAFKITVGGMEITANNATDVADLVRAMEAAKPQKQQKPEDRQPEAERQPAKEGNARRFPYGDIVLSFLTALANHQTLDGPAVQKALDVKEPKGVGSRAGKVNELIAELGFKQDEVYLTRRTREGRTWTAGPKIAEAINAIKGAK